MSTARQSMLKMSLRAGNPSRICSILCRLRVLSAADFVHPQDANGKIVRRQKHARQVPHSLCPCLSSPRLSMKHAKIMKFNYSIVLLSPLPMSISTITCLPRVYLREGQAERHKAARVIHDRRLCCSAARQQLMLCPRIRSASACKQSFCTSTPSSVNSFT